MSGGVEKPDTCSGVGALASPPAAANEGPREPGARIEQQESAMYNIFYLIGVIVVILAVLSFLGIA